MEGRESGRDKMIIKTRQLIYPASPKQSNLPRLLSQDKQLAGYFLIGGD
jgi:hypothetical protein